MRFSLLLILFCSLSLLAQKDDIIHIVQPSETLYGISRQYNVSVDHILNKNPFLRVEVLEMNDTLIIYGGDPVISSPLPSEEPPFDVRFPQEENKKHIVQEKETLYSLSKKYDITVKNILAYNPQIESDVIKVSDTIMIPLNIIIKQNDNGVAQDTIHGNFIHVVEQGETLYGISKRYEVPLEQLLAGNDHLDQQIIEIGDTLQIDKSGEVLTISPSDTKATKSSAFTPPAPGTAYIDEDMRTKHVVKEGETLFGLSQRYKISISDIVKWNQLVETKLMEGQRLIVALSEEEKREAEIEANAKERVAVHTIDYSKLKPVYHKVADGETLGHIAKIYNQRIDIVKEWNHIKSDSDPLPKEMIVSWYLPKGSSGSNSSSVKPTVTSSAKERDFRENYQKRNRNQMTYKMIQQRSKGTWLRDNTSFDQNYYALHRSAPPKSYLRVVNPMNNRTVYVKVIGKLPDTGENADVDLKLTYAAVKKLGLRDDKFLLDWSYHIPK